MSLRITLATYDDEPPVGGQGVLVRGMRAALIRRGLAVRTVAGVGAHAIVIPRRTGRPPLDLSIVLSRNPAHLTAGGAEVVHVMGGPGGVLLLRAPGPPVVYTANHTYRQAYGWRSPRRLLSVAEAAAYRRAAAVLAVSPSTAAAVRRLGVDASRIEVVAPGVEVERIAAIAAHVEREPDRMLFVGRLEAEKGPLDAVAVMAAVAARRPGARGVVIGRGRLAERVRAAAAAVPGGRVEILGGVDDDRVAREYGRAAVLLMPSAYEGLGFTALEALVAGTAVVGYDVTGLRDAAGVGGRLVAAGDRAGLVAAVLELLADPARRDEQAERGRACVLRDHSWDAAARRIEEIYRSVAAGRH